jgi:Flp pilus assembly protein TadD
MGQGIGMFRVLVRLLAGLLAAELAACETTGGAPPWAGFGAPTTTATIQSPDEINYFPSDEPLRLAVEYFNRGNYGLSERYFQDAAEKSPKDSAAWIGLAASYDRTRRFELADRAYREAIKVGGETTQLLNNQGYSYMLRGDNIKARQKFMQAYRQDPNNPTVINNIALLDGSEHSVQRPQ